MNKWDNRFIQMAALVSTWSKDKIKVGCVITDLDNKIVGLGYNGAAKFLNDASILTQENKNDYMIHAEINAIINAGNCTDCILYVYPFLPCVHCASVIINAGIVKVISTNFPKNKWKPDQTLKIFEEANINVEITKCISIA